MTQEKIADSWIEIEQFRLLVLRTAWLIDKHKDYKQGAQGHRRGQGRDAEGATTTSRSGRMHLHGALGVSNEMPFVGMMVGAEALGHRRRPDRGAQDHVARQVLKQYEPVDGLFPSAHIPTRRDEARARFADLLEHEVATH